MLPSESCDVGRRRSIAVSRGGVTASVCQFAVARESRRESERRFTGISAGLAKKFEPPRDIQREERIDEALRAFARRYREGAELQYTHIVACRAGTFGGRESYSKTAAVWAFAGRVPSPRGIQVPLGWSGSGDGLECLTDWRLNANFDWLVSTVDCAVGISSGAVPVVMSAQAAAVLLHEAVGHFAEASPDASDLRHRLGLRVAADDISVVDDPRFPRAAAMYDFDDEGVEYLARTQIVRNGVLTTQLHSRESAERAGTLSTGNGRAAMWARPIPRMSNLICNAGEFSEAALVDQLGQGLFIHHLAHGFGRGLSVEARIVLAEQVIAGRRSGLFVTGGRVLDRVGLMTRVVARGERLEANPNGMCGKRGQILFDVGTVAPAMRLTHLELAT
jgi:TldD protein